MAQPAAVDEIAAGMTVVWIGGASCDGCTTAALGATAPGLEALLEGEVAHLPPVRLVHALLASEAGAAFCAELEGATRGEASPFVLVVEGSLLDEGLAGEGYFSRIGEERSVGEWVALLAPMAGAVLAIGSCATWGGVPAAAGNVTGAHGVEELLGPGFRAASGLRLVNLPGCAPSGEIIVECLVAILRHLARQVPLELDEHGRPAWLYAEDVAPTPPRADWSEAGGGEPLTHVRCAIPARGWTRGLGGCAGVGGACIGCTGRDFTDRYLELARPHTR